MFEKIHYTFYDWMFEYYGKLGKHYFKKAEEIRASKTNELRGLMYEQKAWKCIEKREDILTIMYALKGLI